MGFDNSGVVLLSALGGLGASLVCFSLLAGGLHTATARRMAVFIGDGSVESGRSASRASLRRRLTVSTARIGAHSGPVRAFLAGIILVVGIPAAAAGSIAGLAVALVAALLLVLASRQGQFREQIERQATTAVGLIASGLRAGYSTPQAIALVARESPDPTASLFARAARQLELGRGLVETLETLAQETASRDYDLLATIVSVQHETGGNLAEALDAVAETLRERFELREQLQALTAQQRLSSVILTLLPVGVFGFLLLVNRPFVEPLLSSAVGRTLLTLVAVLLAAGWVVMRAIARLEE